MIKASSIEVLNKKTWEKVEGFKGVKKGDIFRMFNTDGTQIFNGTYYTYEAIDEASINSDGFYEIQMTPIDPEEKQLEIIEDVY